MDGRKGGWKDGKAGLRIAYSNQKYMGTKINNMWLPEFVRAS